jgi:hypothetical protein
MEKMNSPRSKLRGITLASPKSVWRHSSPLQAAEYSAVGSIKLTREATYLKGVVAMGGFVITIEQAENAILRAEEDRRLGKSLTFEKAREEVRQLNPSIFKNRTRLQKAAH